MNSRTLMSISEFCDEARISRATFYNLKKKRMLPPIFKMGSRTFISRKSFERWISEQEADAVAA